MTSTPTRNVVIKFHLSFDKTTILYIIKMKSVLCSEVTFYWKKNFFNYIVLYDISYQTSKLCKLVILPAELFTAVSFLTFFIVSDILNYIHVSFSFNKMTK